MLSVSVIPVCLILACLIVAYSILVGVRRSA
jgi:hypothetical protein